EDEIVRLGELHVAAVEDRIDADLASGGAEELVAELEGLVARHPLRERLRGQLMLALYRAGRHADALAAYQDAPNARPAARGRHGPQTGLPAADPPAGPRGAPALAPGGGAAPPVVGRDPARAVLEAGVDAAPAGRARLFLVVGPAGAGKTKLADELASRAKAR